jgi:hypothetical protein
MSQVDLLYRLQQIDDDSRSSKERLKQIIRRQKESETLAVARKRAENAAGEHRQWQSRQNELALEFGSLNDKVKRSENRLYSGTVKNPKELADLQQEIDSLARRNSQLEDELLEAMIMVEEAQEEDSLATDSLTQIKIDWDQNQLDIQAEQAELINRIRELTILRQQQVEKILPASMAAYENAIKRAGITAVVPMSNSRCRGCQVRVPTTLVKAADEGRLVNCDSCGRIICPV